MLPAAVMFWYEYNLFKINICFIAGVRHSVLFAPLVILGILALSPVSQHHDFNLHSFYLF